MSTTQWELFKSEVGLGKCLIGTPGAGWQNPDFNDESWTVPMQAGGFTGIGAVDIINPNGGNPSPTLQSTLVTGYVNVWPGPGPSPSHPITGSFRFPFFLPQFPAASVSFAPFTILASVISASTTPTFYLNGTAPTSATAFGRTWTLVFPSTLLLPGYNLLAIQGVTEVPFYVCTASFAASIQVIYPAPGYVNPYPAWLIVDEPGIGLTDRSHYLYLGTDTQHSFNLQARQRGTANYTLVVSPSTDPAADISYTPTIGSPMYLYDQTPQGYTLAFAGIIQDWKNRQIGLNGPRYIDCAAASLEVVFDQVYAEPMQFVDQTTDQILIALYTAFAVGSQVSLGAITPGQALPLFNTNYEKLSDLFDQLATTDQYIWGVDPRTQQLYYQPPETTPAPFNITSSLAMWDSISWGYDAADYRNRQAVRLSDDAFSHSYEFFANNGSGTQQQFTLLRAANQVVNAWVTLLTPNTAVGTFSGQPNVGDTVTTAPASGSWADGVTYAVGGIIVVNGYVYKVTTAGGLPTTGAPPVWPIITGATVGDSGANIWTCQGPLGLGTGEQTYTFCQADLSAISPYYGQWQANSTYTLDAEIFIIGGSVQQATAGTSGATEPVWVNTIGGTTTDGSITWTCLGPWLDNTVFGMVLIGATAADTCQNLIDAINANAVTRGQAFSLPTWENSRGNALDSGGLYFTFQQKGPGTSNVTAVGATGTAFSWASANTTGGTAPQGSLGPNEGATISLQVYAEGTNTAAPGLAYTQGSAVVNLATPLSKGNLCVEYTRPDGNVIECENTPLVGQLANLTYGTGKVQQISDQSSQGLISTNSGAGLQLAQQVLAAFDVVPFDIEVELVVPGIFAGQLLTMALTGYPSLLNASYFVQEVSAKLVPLWPWMDQTQAPGGGHYRYSIKVIDVAQIQDFMGFWKDNLGSGSSGSGGSGGAAGGSSLVATSGGGITSTGAALTEGGVNNIGNTGNYTAQASDYGLIVSFNSSSTPRTLYLPTTPPFTQWNIFVENVGAANLSVNPNGLNLDGGAGGLTIPQNQGVYISTDGANYFTSRGLLPQANVGAVFQIDAVTVGSLTNKVTFSAIPSTFNHLQIWIMAVTSDGVWQASTSYALGTILVQIYTATSTYYYWKVTTAGTSGGTIPAFSTHNSGTLTDGSVVWTNEGVDASANMDASFILNADLSGTNYFRAFVQGSTSANAGTTNPVSNPPVNGPQVGAYMPTPRNAHYQIPVCAVVNIPFYKNTAFGKTIVTSAADIINGPGAGLLTATLSTAAYLPSAAITQIDLYVQDGTYFAVGSSFILYGIS